MSTARGAGTADRAAKLAAAASALGQPEWAADAARLAGGDAPEAPAVAPTYRQLARTGLDLVEGLAGEGRWDEAAGQARYLSRYFAGARQQLHAVAGEAFDGLHAAVRARDAEELEDFADLLRTLFP